MTNIAPTPLSAMHPKFQALACKNWIPQVAPSDVTHFLTVSLFEPRHDVDPEKWNQRTSAQRQDIIGQMVERFDKRLYGRSHLKIPSEKKFQFLLLEETRDRNKCPTFAHLHGVISFSEVELRKLSSVWPSIEQDIVKLVRARGLQPDVLLVTADDNVIDYVGKDALFQAEMINTRATMNTTVTEPVSL